MSDLIKALHDATAAGKSLGEISFQIRASQALEAAGMTAAASLVIRLPTAQFPASMIPDAQT
jgi:hypothetical protein